MIWLCALFRTICSSFFGASVCSFEAIYTQGQFVLLFLGLLSVALKPFVVNELNLPQAVVNRLQTVGIRFCGPADQALARLRGVTVTDSGIPEVKPSPSTNGLSSQVLNKINGNAATAADSSPA
ncbi:uncharacterized protein LOC103956549 isoform X2 [Pyrus x bretschneideri]|uniref:uncharacterized protein LOC103956549 isoform X2 n=1 Tax=Pyrus x bretschneideri TaxID=225117 RepID=UPI00202EA5A3|nr:uncharacterized protein LOC103956549 isoform X2 [Pyrus x bretschneideri]